LFPKGIIQVEINGMVHKAEYMGRQEGFECSVCGKGGKCYTFNILHGDEKSYYEGNYETLGFGREHLDHVKLVESPGPIQKEG
jgi:ribosomal protein L21E